VENNLQKIANNLININNLARQLTPAPQDKIIVDSIIIKALDCFESLTTEVKLKK